MLLNNFQIYEKLKESHSLTSLDKSLTETKERRDRP